jgi:TRAP-type C4-dicarboxylate transport system substrate-binding protein
MRGKAFVWMMAAVVVASALATSAEMAVAQQVQWKAAIYGPPRAFTHPLEWFAKEVAAKTNGQVKIELVYGEALAKATEMPEGVKGGAFEVASFCTSYYPGKFPLTTLLDLPMFAPDDVAAIGRLQIALSEHPAQIDEFKKWNLRLLIPGPLPQYQIMSQRKITKVEDFKGLRIRVSGEMAKVLEDYGAVKSLVPAPEVFPSLERGVIDAATFPSTYAFFSYRLHEISKYFIDKISLGTQPCFFAVGLPAWNKLSPHQQKIMLDLREGAVLEAAKAYKAADDKNYALMKERGMEIINFPPAERAKLVANARKYWDAWDDNMQKRGIKGAKELFGFAEAKLKEFTKK